MPRTFLFFLISLLFTLTSTQNTCSAQTPVANRVKAFAKVISKEAHVVAKYTDDQRHCLYFTYGSRLFRYDVLTDKKNEVTFSDNSYSKIISTWISPDSKYIFLTVDKGVLSESYFMNGQELWRYDTFNLSYKRIGSGFSIIKKPKYIIIKKATRCLNPQAPADQQHWMATDHYFYADGTMSYTKEEYRIH
jgi:hypothetical protein